jgi:UDPglucose--hexose-1-phosphate uridylyltransferase
MTEHGKTLLEDYVHEELRQRERLLVENDYFVALVPFWATWPFEAMIVSKRPGTKYTCSSIR